MWSRAPNGPELLDPLPEPPDAISRRCTFTYEWDAVAARRNPAAALADFETFVRAATEEVVSRVRRAAGDLGFVGSVARSQQGAAGAPAGTAAPNAAAGAGVTRLDETALRQLDARVADTLRAHRARLQTFLADRDRARSQGRGPGGSHTPIAVDPSELEADLA
jgi:hypothetical protein